MMATIPGWGYALVGGSIAGYSWYIGNRADIGAMRLFFWIGVALFVIGIFKIAIKFMVGNKESEVFDERREKTERPAFARDHLVCPRCNAKLHPRSRYCNWCATRQ